jgi:hypothetical protein
MSPFLTQLVSLKNQLNALPIRKTKAAREKQRDVACGIRRQMANLVHANAPELSTLILKHHKSLNVMAPVGGPLYTGEAAVSVYAVNSGHVQLTLDEQWVGLVYLWENSCGMDNVLLLAKAEDNNA